MTVAQVAEPRTKVDDIDLAAAAAHEKREVDWLTLKFCTCAHASTLRSHEERIEPDSAKRKYRSMLTKSAPETRCTG